MGMETTGADLDFRAVFAMVPGPFLILDRAYRIVAANRRYEEAMGKPPGSLLGRNLLAMFAGGTDSSCPTDFQGPRNLKASLDRVLSLGVADTLPIQRFPVASPPSGGGGMGDRYWNVGNFPVPGPEGRVDFILHQVEDVTACVQSGRGRYWSGHTGEGMVRPQDFEAGIFLQTHRLAVANRNLEDSNRELARLGTACKEAHRRKQRLLQDLAWKFQAPLTALLDHLEGLRSGPAGRPRAGGRRHAEAAAAKGLDLVRLVNRMEDMLQLDAERDEADFRPVDLAAVTASVAEGFRAYAGLSGTAFEVFCPALPVQAHVDRAMWEKLLLNLLSNAFKAAPQGRVGLRLRDSGGMAVLEVSDNGGGIPESSQAHLFDGIREDGTGLGLALVKKLAQLHRGEVLVASTKGKGTQVTVRIPYRQDPRKGAKEHPPREKQSDPRSSRTTADTAAPPVPGSRILVADGNPDAREIAHRLLRGLWRVQAVGTGRDAIDRCLEEPPDLILCAEGLPDLEGAALVRILRAHPGTRSLPILLLSGKAGEAAASEALDAGADACLRRPLPAKELIASVDAHLRLAGLRRQGEEENLAGYRRSLEADKLETVGRLAAGVAHDFNNILTAVNGYTELALAMTRDTGLRQCLLEIKEAGTKAAETAGLLLAYGRRQICFPRPLRLNDLVDEMQPALRNLFQGTFHLVIRLDYGLPKVAADRAQMLQVIMNLARNAKEAMPEGGTLTLETANSPGEAGPPEASEPGNALGFVRMIFKDTGVGIDPADLGRIFEPYYTSKPFGAVKGKGLGLSSVSGIIRQHRGHIRVSSRPGEGSVFEILLPVAEPAEGRPDRAAADESEPVLDVRGGGSPGSEMPLPN